MDVRLYDNYEDDGQLSLFGMEDMEGTSMEDVEGTSMEDVESTSTEDVEGTSMKNMESISTEAAGEASGKPLPEGGIGVRIGHCSSCGKLLAVKEEADGYYSRCNNCNIRYFQKK